MIAILVSLAAMAAVQGGYVGDANDPDRCRFEQKKGAMTLAIANDTIKVAPGEVAKVSPSWTPYPSAWDSVPHRCLSGWRVSDPKLARLSPDHRTLTFATDAKEGATVTLTARYRGKKITQAYRVIHPVVSPLIGSWQQRAADCPGGDDVFELRFRRDGSFSVTFDTPMHSRTDYDGRWAVEGDQLILSNITPYSTDTPVPADLATRSAFKIAPDGTLGFAVPWYGHRRDAICRAVFVP